LFSDSVYNNIAFGKPGAVNAEVEEAAKMASADSFIEELPEKYETEIGERGVKLLVARNRELQLHACF
jgi:ATP-binding cassette subfamily B protein